MSRQGILITTLGTIYYHLGNYLFPPWELFIPTLGTIYSHPGNYLFPPWEYFII